MKYYPPRFLFRRYEILRRVKRGNNFLEIGPGNLNLAQDLLCYFDRGTLVDYNPAVKKRYNNLPESLKKRLALVIADFSPSISFQTKYDCIVACEVMEHVDNEERFLDTMIGLLSNQGQLVLSVPSRMKFWSKHDEIVGHLKRYERDDIVKLLSKQNLKNVTVISYGFPFVNILRWPRILLAQIQYHKKIRWSQKKQTQQSGFMQATLLTDLLGIVCNRYTTYSLNLLSSLFNQYDLSDGYVIIAEKHDKG
jgi:SAM-dependent methyltransferase